MARRIPTDRKGPKTVPAIFDTARGTMSVMTLLGHYRDALTERTVFG